MAVGGVVSAALVVNDQEVEVIVLPERSSAPLSVTVYVVAGLRLAAGSSVTIRLDAS